MTNDTRNVKQDTIFLIRWATGILVFSVALLSMLYLASKALESEALKASIEGWSETIILLIGVILGFIVLAIMVVISVFIASSFLPREDRQFFRGELSASLNKVTSRVSAFFSGVGIILKILFGIALVFIALWFLMRLIHWMWIKPIPIP